MRSRIWFIPALLLCLLFVPPAVSAQGFAAEDEAADLDAEVPFETLDSLFNLYQPYLNNIAAYQPIYFLAGADPKDSKFQISLKYRFLNPDPKTYDESSIYRKIFNGFHIAYTQTSFWNLRSDSAPFEDTSYKPELFFLSPNLFSGAGLTHIFVQSGFQHESNGQGGTDSRSTNFLYVEPIFIFFHESSGIGFSVAPKIWCYVDNEDENNRDLYKYRGYFDLQIKAGKAKGAVMETHFRWADEGASVRLDLSYPLDRLIDTRLQLYVHAQYVNALAESLLDYPERNRAFRLGISIVR